MTAVAFLGALDLGLIYSLVALGLLVSYRVLNIADMTSDGSFTLGAAVCGILTAGGHPLLGILAGSVAGMLAGVVTGLLQTKLRVQPILAGIITMVGLYSVNLMVMGGRSNITLLRTETLYTLSEGALPLEAGRLLLLCAIAFVVCLGLYSFFQTRLGLCIRATGDNREMVCASGVNPEGAVLVGLALANGLIALSGALLAQYQQFCEITIGTGMVVLGLASLIIGEVLVGGEGLASRLLGAVAGSVLYRILMAAALAADIPAYNLKLVSALLVAAAISIPALREQAAVYQLRKAGGRHADRSESV